MTGSSVFDFDGEPLTFYDGPPNAPSSPTDVWMNADDDGTGHAVTSECDGTNNLGTLLGVQCGAIQ